REDPARPDGRPRGDRRHRRVSAQRRRALPHGGLDHRRRRADGLRRMRGAPAMRRATMTLLLFTTAALAGCGYNRLQSGDEGAKASWAEVLNQYQRRNDLVPNLVNTVKGYAAHEREVLTRVTEARAKVGSIQATPQLVDDPEAFAKFIAAQNEMT